MIDFVLVGAMRSGTTTLFRAIASHPAVHAPVKEPGWFRSSHDHGELASILNASDGRLVGEATPDYMTDPDVVEAIHETAPDAKIIMLFRDPADRFWSHAWHQIRNARLDLAAAFDASRYFAWWSVWDHWFGSVLAVRSETLWSPGAEGAAELQRVFRFLGLDPADGPVRVDEPTGGRVLYPEMGVEAETYLRAAFRQEAERLCMILGWEKWR